MNIRRTWVVASTTIAIAGFAGAGVALASDDVELKDPQHAPVVQLHADQADSAGGSADSPGGSNGSADSPGAPGHHGSADSAADSPGEPGYTGTGASSSADSAADSPGEQGYGVPAQAKPAAAPVPAPPPVVVADSGDSPAPVHPPVHSADSGNSGPARTARAETAAGTCDTNGR